VLDDVVHLFRLRRERAVPLDSMQAAFNIFKQHAVVPQEDALLVEEGYLTKEHLAAVLEQMAVVSDDELDRELIIDEAFRIADKDGNGTISFREFAIWVSSHSFDASGMHLEADELELRKLGRKLGVDAKSMDTYKRYFDEFDADGSGEIDREEFEEMLYKCLRIPRHIGLPASRVQQLWRAADYDGGGGIDMEEFVKFYMKYFSQVGGAECKGLQQFYSQGLSQRLSDDP
jgi:Ca2+-binding EF-hand superfamily protein